MSTWLSCDWPAAPVDRHARYLYLSCVVSFRLDRGICCRCSQRLAFCSLFPALFHLAIMPDVLHPCLVISPAHDCPHLCSPVALLRYQTLSTSACVWLLFLLPSLMFRHGCFFSSASSLSSRLSVSSSEIQFLFYLIFFYVSHPFFLIIIFFLIRD